MLSLGLTGNIGCGKSTVARLFGEQGAGLIDADAIVHELLERGGPAAEAVAAAFPEARAENGAIDRALLGRLVFAEPSARRALETILHPLVVGESRHRLEELGAAGRELALTEAALLYEAARSGSAGADSLDRFDAIVVVTCDEATQLARLLERAGAEGRDSEEAEADARRRMSAQLPQSEKAAAADFVIDNSGSLENTRRQVLEVLAELRQRAVPS